jgi:hypothetical protein
VYQIFIPPHIGLADNGDFARIIDKVGIKPGPNKHYMNFINLTFPIEFQYNLKGYQSSELIFVLISILINGIIFRDGQFHLLVLAMLHSLFWLIGLGMIAFHLPKKMGWLRIVVYVCILVFFTDVGYISYLNSIYSEPATIIFLTMMIGLFFITLRQVPGEKSFWIFMAAFLGSGGLFVIAKPQNAAMGILVAFLGFRMMTAFKISKIAVGRLRTLGFGIAIGVVAFSFLFFAFGLPEYYRSGDLWNSIFMEIVGRSKTPERDLQMLGLPEGMVIFKGTNAFSEGVNRNEWDQFQHSWLYFRVLRFYIFNPGRLMEMLDLSTVQGFELQQANLGNFEQDAGYEPYTKSQEFVFWNQLRTKLLPKSVWTLMVLFLVNLFVPILKIWKLDNSINDRLVSELHLAVMMMAVLQYLTVLMAEGTFEIVKHMMLFNFLADILFVFLTVYFVWGIERLSTAIRLRNFQI